MSSSPAQLWSPFRQNEAMAMEQVPKFRGAPGGLNLISLFISPFSYRVRIALKRNGCSPWDESHVHQDEWPSQCLKFTMAPSWNGGFDINIGSHVIRVPKYLSVQHPLVQMVLFAACDVYRSFFTKDVQYGSVFRCPKSIVPKCIVDMVKISRSCALGRQATGFPASRVLGEGGVTVATGAHGSVSSVVATVSHDRCEETDDRGPGSEPDKTDWQQQQPQQDKLTRINHVAGLDYLLRVDAGLEHAFGAPADKGCLPACQGKIQIDPTKLGEMSANSGSLISSEQNGARQGDRSVLTGCGSLVATEHPISIAPKKTDPTAAWLIASAAPHHATGNRALLSDFAPYQGDLFVKSGDAGAAPMRVIGSGNVVTDTVVIPDVWYVPGLTANVVSVSQLAELDYSVAFAACGECYVRSADDDNVVVVGAARAGEDGLYALDFIKVPLGS